MKSCKPTMTIVQKMNVWYFGLFRCSNNSNELSQMFTTRTDGPVMLAYTEVNERTSHALMNVYTKIWLKAGNEPLNHKITLFIYFWKLIRPFVMFFRRHQSGMWISIFSFSDSIRIRLHLGQGRLPQARARHRRPRPKT